jgi:hypothetical protein
MGLERNHDAGFNGMWGGVAGFLLGMWTVPDVKELGDTVGLAEAC